MGIRLTKMLVAEFGREEQALLRICVNGTFYTEDALHISEADRPLCPCCGKKDGISHRVWECEVLAHVREQSMRRFPVQPSLLLPCQANHAWARRPASQHLVEQGLLQIPAPGPPFLAAEHVPTCSQTGRAFCHNWPPGRLPFPGTRASLLMLWLPDLCQGWSSLPSGRKSQRCS